MATIQTSIILTDRVSNALNNIMHNLDATSEAFNRLNNAQNGMNSGELGAIRSQLNSITEQYRRIIDEITNAGDRQRRLNDEINNGENRVTGFVKQLIGMGAAYFSFNATVGGIKSAIDYASDLVEVQNVVDVTFDTMANDINKWSQTTSSAFGISELTAKQYSSTLGAMMKSGGLAGDTIKNMSMNMSQLAADMASFYNLESDVAFDKIRSGLSGETEPLKQLGIDMSVAGLEAFRMAQGIDVSYSSMDNASKMVLRYQYLMSQTKDAQGDFLRTQDSFANQTRLLSQTWQNFTGQLASNALPILTEIIYILNSGLNVLSSVGQLVSENWSIIAPILGALVVAVILYNDKLLLSYWNTIKNTAATIAQGAANMYQAMCLTVATIAQEGLNGAIMSCPLSWMLMLIILIVAAIVALVAAFNKWRGTSVSVIGLIGGLIGGLAATTWNTCVVPIQNAFAILVNFLANCFTNPIAAVKAGFYDMASSAIGYIEWMAKAIEDILNKIPGVNVDLTSGLSAFKAGLEAKSKSVKDEAGLKDVIDKWDYMDVGGAAKTGYGLGVSARDWVVDKLTPGTTDPGEYFDVGDYDFTTAAGDTAKNTGNTAGNTSDIKDKLDVTNEKLEYLHDIAEREAINRFTTAEININQTNHNNMNGGDIDGIMNTVVDGLKEAIYSTVEGVTV